MMNGKVGEPGKWMCFLSGLVTSVTSKVGSGSIRKSGLRKVPQIYQSLQLRESRVRAGGVKGECSPFLLEQLSHTDQ